MDLTYKQAVIFCMALLLIGLTAFAGGYTSGYSVKDEEHRREVEFKQETIDTLSGTVIWLNSEVNRLLEARR